jgi:IclR family transcriptional regulator, KDG regulon repressor
VTKKWSVGGSAPNAQFIDNGAIRVPLSIYCFPIEYLITNQKMTMELGIMTAKNPVTNYSAPILYKAFAILNEIAADQQKLGISDLARKLNMSKGTLHGIAQAFLDLGVITQDSNKKFRLGSTLIELGNKALAGDDLRLSVRPFLEELYSEFKETVFLGTSDGKKITIIDKVDSPYGLKISAPVGSRLSLLAGATGKIFLSAFTDEDLQGFLRDSLPKFTENSIADRSKYIEEIKKVREQGYATDFEEYMQGVNAVCAPVTDMYGQTKAAIWMVGFSNALNNEKISQAIIVMSRSAKRERDRKLFLTRR